MPHAERRTPYELVASRQRLPTGQHIALWRAQKAAAAGRQQLQSLQRPPDILASSPATATAMTTTTTITATTTTTTTMLRTTNATITSDPGILCFHHCNVKVFCFALPHICPNCKHELDTGDDVGGGGGGGTGAGDGAVRPAGSGILPKLLPFRLPYPFVRASQYPCAIVLRPTTGDFLNDYNNATDLHIAVTTSTGCVVEFDRHGLQRHRADNMPEWWQCLLVGDVPEPWYDYWDQVLLQICQQPERWSVAHYHEDTHNCYTFVLAFLQALAYDKLSEAAHSKTTFCEKYIVPRTTTAGKYISLYRKLRDAGIYVHPHHHHGRQRHQQPQPQHQHQQQQKQRGKSRAGAAPSTVAANGHSGGSKAPSLILRPPNLCTIEE